MRSVSCSASIVLVAMLACGSCGTTERTIRHVQSRGDEAYTKADLTLLSFQISHGVDPEPSVIEQIARHIRAIEGKEPRIHGLAIRRPFDASALALEVDDATAAAIQSGTYGGWMKLHSGLLVKTVRVKERVVTIEYGAMYNTPALARRYERLPGVLSVDPVWNIGDGSWIYIQRGRSDWSYIVDIGSGDCIAGCATHELFYFVFDAAGAIQREERWTIPNVEASPSWVEEWREQRRSR